MRKNNKYLTYVLALKEQEVARIDLEPRGQWLWYEGNQCTGSRDGG